MHSSISSPCATEGRPPLFSDEKRTQDQAERGQQLDHHMQRRAHGIFERISHGISRHRSLVRLRPLAPMRPALNVLLGVVPCPASGVQEQRHEDASNGGKHEHAGHCLGAQKRLPRDRAHPLEDDADRNGAGNRQHTGLDHRPQRGRGNNGHATSVIGLLCVRHDAWPLRKLPAHFVHHLLCGVAHGGACPGRENEDEGGPQQPANEHLRHGDVHLLERHRGEGGNLIQIRGEQQEGGQPRGPNGIALGGGLGGVAYSVQQVGDVPHRLRLLRHLHNAARVVRNGAENVHCEHVCCR